MPRSNITGVYSHVVCSDDVDYKVEIHVHPYGPEIEGVTPEPGEEVWSEIEAHVKRLYRDNPEFYNDSQHFQSCWEV